MLSVGACIVVAHGISAQKCLVLYHHAQQIARGGATEREHSVLPLRWTDY